MARACPWCCEPVPRKERDAGVCPSCGRPLIDDEGRELREIDLRYDQAEASQRRQYRAFLLYGTPSVAVVSLVVPLTHVGVALVVPMMMLAHMVVLRVVLLRHARRLLGSTRRMFVRWLGRFSFLWLGLAGYGLTAVPLFGALFGGATFAGLTALVHHYALWSLVRERDRKSLMMWEKLLLVGLAAVTVALFVILVAGALLLGWGVTKLFQMVSG